MTLTNSGLWNDEGVRQRKVAEAAFPALPVVTAFKIPPDGGAGLSRDMRVRWALEEVGQPYQLRLLSFMDMKRPAHRQVHPFGQLPTYEHNGLALFESGAIVLHIASNHSGLLPAESQARSRAIMWMFAALNTIEPPITMRMENYIGHRLGELSEALGGASWLDGEFSAGDLLMVTVLRTLRDTYLLHEHPKLMAYVERGEARPAFARAMAARAGLD